MVFMGLNQAIGNLQGQVWDLFPSSQVSDRAGEQVRIKNKWLRLTLSVLHDSIGLLQLHSLFQRRNRDQKGKKKKYQACLIWDKSGEKLGLKVKSWKPGLFTR